MYYAALYRKRGLSCQQPSPLPTTSGFPLRQLLHRRVWKGTHAPTEGRQEQKNSGVVGGNAWAQHEPGSALPGNAWSPRHIGCGDLRGTVSTPHNPAFSLHETPVKARLSADLMGTPEHVTGALSAAASSTHQVIILALEFNSRIVNMACGPARSQTPRATVQHSDPNLSSLLV